MATLALSSTSPESMAVDAVVVGAVQGNPDQPGSGVALPAGTGAVDAALDGRLAEAIEALGATGAEGEVTLVPTLGSMAAPVLAVVGLGAAPDDGAGFDPGVLRRASAAAARALPGRSSIATTLAQAGGATRADAVRATAEGALLGSYEFTAHRATDDKHRALPSAITVCVEDRRDDAIRTAGAQAEATAAAVVLARDLVNTPPNVLPPAELADRAQAAAKRAGVDCEILDEKALAKGGYGGILGVGSGSARPPRLIRLHWSGSKPKARIALVGKGITFDSGGISIKPAANMHHMTSDMAGAAAVIGVMTALAALKLPIEVTATVPLAENLVGGRSYRPGDVLTMYGGRTVEVLNTDAEGRLVLADAIVRAGEDKPDYLIDTATLTGAQVVSLGNRTAGVMGTDEFRDRVAAIGRRVDEDAWAMPLPAHLRTGLDSTIADIANVSADRAGGMLVAGQFLAVFVPDGVQWAHVDVAGPAYNAGPPWGSSPTGGTGVPVRTIIATLEDIAAAG